jgi:hypothetical protein
MKSNTIWVLISGLAVGFVVGREMPRKGESESPDKPPSAAAAAPTVVPGEIPANWIKEDGLKAADKFAGLTPAQRYLVLKVMNEKPCDCGCPHGTTAQCMKDDPNCPRAPVILSQAIDLAKQGKNYDQILASVKKPEGGGGGGGAPPPSPNQKVQVAAWSPIKGPKQAKVTIVEFSDFQ